MFCRICGNNSGNERECKRCIYFLDHGADEAAIRRMLSDDKTKAIWKGNEKTAEELARVYYNHVIENYSLEQVKKHSKENLGFNTFIDGIRLGLDVIMPLLDEGLKKKVNEKIDSMMASRRIKDLRMKKK